MEQLTIQSSGSLIGFPEDIKIPRPLGTTNHTNFRVSFRISRRYQNPSDPWNNLVIQSSGFLFGFQEDIKIPRPHGTINHTIIRFLQGFQEDIKIPRPH